MKLNTAELLRCFKLLAKAITQVQVHLTPREKLALKLGLHASHAEEALTQGDAPRAIAHFRSMLKLSKKLGA